MAGSYTLGAHFDGFLQAQLAGGRYKDASEVLRDALRLMEDQERRLAALDAAIGQGLADLEAGQVSDLDQVCDALIAEVTALPHSAA